jgi:pyocin large subunit-like protein
MSRTRTITAAAAVLLALAGCDDGASAVETRERPAAGPDRAVVALTSAPADAVAAAEGPPAMTANRRETVDEKVIRLFERNGADFAARSPADYLEKVRAFTTRPPQGTERVERANGDVLLYQASTNTFAVVARDGAPRTMFKPDEGAAYWAEQKARAPDFGRRRSSPD